MGGAADKFFVFFNLKNTKLPQEVPHGTGDPLPYPPLYLGEKSPERDTLVGGVGYLIFRFWAEGIP
jgi:hypothetical protein